MLQPTQVIYSVFFILISLSKVSFKTLSLYHAHNSCQYLFVSFRKIFFSLAIHTVAFATLLIYYVLMELKDRIKYLRALHGLTLEQVGDYVGVGKSTVRKWENGIIANMKRDKIAKLAEVLHTTPAYLMGWEDIIQEEYTEEELSQAKQDLIDKIKSLDDSTVAALNQIADTIISRRDD